MTNPSLEIPTRRDEITAEWLTGFLSGRYPGVVVEAIDVLGATQGAATRLRLGVRYAAGADGGLPTVLFLKAALTRRMLVTDPHMYVTEVRFYDAIRPHVELETPEAFAWDVDEATGRHALLLADLGEQGAAFPSAVTDVTVDDVAALLGNVARLHAAHWARPDLQRRYPWLETSTTGPSAEWWGQQARGVAEQELVAAPYKAAIVGDHDMDRLFAAHLALQRRNDSGVRTVVHGDVHIGNCYLLPSGGGGLLDWQLMMIAGWACDVGYLLVTALDTETRRASERDLLRHYLSELASAGIEPPGWDDAWAEYRAQMLWGVVTWLVTPTAMYDEPRLTALLQRCAAAVADHDSYLVLGA